jgi:hypothetical protein
MSRLIKRLPQIRRIKTATQVNKIEISTISMSSPMIQSIIPPPNNPFRRKLAADRIEARCSEGIISFA